MFVVSETVVGALNQGFPFSLLHCRQGRSYRLFLVGALDLGLCFLPPCFPREQLCNMQCSNKHTQSRFRLGFHLRYLAITSLRVAHAFSVSLCTRSGGFEKSILLSSSSSQSSFMAYNLASYQVHQGGDFHTVFLLVDIFYLLPSLLMAGEFSIACPTGWPRNMPRWRCLLATLS